MLLQGMALFASKLTTYMPTTVTTFSSLGLVATFLHVIVEAYRLPSLAEFTPRGRLGKFATELGWHRAKCTFTVLGFSFLALATTLVGT